MRSYLAGAVGAAVFLAAGCTDTKELVAPASKVTLPNGPSLNTPVTGAGFTTTNPTAVDPDNPVPDGTGHCKNGNEAVNCNIYDGKIYVWLNGGPVEASLGAGDYFFAVLDPGGQGGNQNPNDGTEKNLSDVIPTSNTPGGDVWTNRRFHVDASGTITYSGTHDFADNKIRLFPYDNTTNPGGVYIMAICSLADADAEASNQPGVDPSDCKYDAFKVQEAGTTPGATAPTIVKDADGAYDNTFTWDVAKAVDKTFVQQTGGSVTFNYTVTVTHDNGTISGVAVTGTISVFNANIDALNNLVPINITSVTDQLSDGTTCTVTGGGAQQLTQFVTTFGYTCDLGTTLPKDPLDNVATVTWPTQTVDGKTLTGSSSSFTFSTISFAENKIDECVAVTDTYAQDLGTLCDTDTSPKDLTYSRTIAVLPGCYDYNNTATITTNDSNTTDDASQKVTVCGPPHTGALTIGFWKGPNGNNLIKTYCSQATPTLQTFLKGLGAGSGPFSNAPAPCADLVTYVNGIISGATATDMNKMLKAQMLATALDVYFSGTGWTGTTINKIKPPSNFLSHNNLGTFKMDLTAICPMVDNTTAGTATCKNNTPSTDGVASGAFASSPMAMQAILDFAATTPSPFNGSTLSSVWYAGNRTKQEILKNVFDQFNNQLAFGSF